MRTNVVIDDRLMAEAIRISKIKTKRKLIETALSEFIESRKRLNLKDLKGKIRFAEDYDYKASRQS